MKIYERLLAGVVWLSKFTIFSPMNMKEDEEQSPDLIQWGNYSIGANLYPNLFNIFVKYSPTASLILKKIVRYAFGNIPKEIKNQCITTESNFTNTIQSLVKNAGRDAFLYDGSFAIWVGYDENGKVNELKWIPIELVRYYRRDVNIYPDTDNEYMIAVTNGESQEVTAIYYPYDPKSAIKQQQRLVEAREEDAKLADGQILFYNTADAQTYPDCVFNSMLPVLLTDAGLDTAVMSFLANSDILKTYKKKSGSSGTDTANGMGGLFDGEVLNSIWGTDRQGGLASTAQYGSDYLNTGVKSAGTTEYVSITTDTETIDHYVKLPAFPQFADEFSKIDERVARKCCLALEVPYEYIFKMESGVLNQDNRATLISEINMQLEDIRETFESVINNILENSIYTWRLELRPIGEDKENVAQASGNITQK